jgi:prepilin-type N-terminal cleavage/methylation domain-containing protein
MRRFPQTSHRGGFTLVELLVVITIIAILFGLIAAASVRLLGKGDEVKLRNEISQLAAAVQAFKTQFAVGYAPDQIILPPFAQSGDSAQVQQLVAETQQFLKSVWPRLNPVLLSNTTSSFTLGTPQTTYPRGVFDYWGVAGNSRVILQGDQCLVFWLGGPRDSGGNILGFCSDPTDPMNPSPQAKRISPFYEFSSDRLVVLPTDSVRLAQFPSLKDVYGAAPYLYFSTGKADNNYRYPVALSASFQVTPYQISSAKFASPNGFQIISAGKDQTFGPGGLAWAGAQNGGVRQEGADDVANFHPTFLGIAAQ